MINRTVLSFVFAAGPGAPLSALGSGAAAIGRQRLETSSFTSARSSDSR
ncbi:MAG: hypothetical protein ACLQKA_12790 [Bryobacteraceae bacterium]